jgi:hypothetical protein
VGNFLIVLEIKSLDWFDAVCKMQVSNKSVIKPIIDLFEIKRVKTLEMQSHLSYSTITYIKLLCVGTTPVYFSNHNHSLHLVDLRHMASDLFVTAFNIHFQMFPQ